MTQTDLDSFGIAKLFPDAPSSRTWNSTWHNGVVRTLDSGKGDPSDPMFVLRGNNPTLDINGDGIAVLAGIAPRMYVYEDPTIQDARKWKNVEVTFYGMRVAESQPWESQGFVCGARSEHQGDSPCDGTAYYGRLLYDNRAEFKKELGHLDHGAGDTQASPGNYHVQWNTHQHVLPSYTWVGYKFVVQNTSSDAEVRLRLFLDMSDGEEGGRWEQLIGILDSGGWAVADVGTCPWPRDFVLSKPTTSVFIRNDFIEKAAYKKFSVREIVADD